MVFCFFFVNLIMQFETHIRKLFGGRGEGGGGGYQTVNSFKEKKINYFNFFPLFNRTTLLSPPSLYHHHISHLSRKTLIKLTPTPLPPDTIIFYGIEGRWNDDALINIMY